MKNSNDSNYTAPSLARGLLIVEMFTESKKALTTQDFCEHLGTSPSDIYRIIQTLVDMNYLIKIARNSYTLGPQTVSNGFSYLANRDLMEIASPHLREMRNATSTSCHLATRDGLDTLYIYRAMATQRLSVNIPIGTRLPCHANAMGRVLLSAKSASEINQLYLGKQLDDLPRPHPQSLLELQELIQSEREQGYAVSRSDNATSIAAPLRNYAGETVAAINASVPDFIVRDNEISETIKNQLLLTATLISQELGYKPIT